MTNYLNGCGYGCLFHPPSEKEKATTKYQRKNSAGLAILWTTVSEEPQGILLENDDLFLTAWNALGDACGKNSTVTICRALTRLTSSLPVTVDITYGPETSAPQCHAARAALTRRFRTCHEVMVNNLTIFTQLICSSYADNIANDRRNSLYKSH